MLNHTTLVGRVVRNPELKESSSGREFCVITLAVTRPFKNQETNEYDTDFLDISVWGTTAVNVVTHCGKGSIVAIRGRIANRTLDFPGEHTVRTIGIIAERVSYIQTKTPDSPPQKNNEADDTFDLNDLPPIDSTSEKEKK